MKPWGGLSAYLCFGKYAGFHLPGRNSLSQNGLVITLGWVSFGIVPIDIEVAVGMLMEELNLALRILKDTKLAEQP